LSGNISVSGVEFLYPLLVSLSVAYLIERGYISKELFKVAFFMLFGLFIMLLVVMYVGRASILFVVALILIYVNTLIKTKEDIKHSSKVKHHG